MSHLKLPQELWDNVSHSLSSFSAMNGASVLQDLGFKSRDREKCHNRLWKRIFKDESWLEGATKYHPLLIGKDIESLSRAKKPRHKHAYAVLMILDRYGDGALNALFTKSLQPHTYNQMTNEYIFDDVIISIHGDKVEEAEIGDQAKRLFKREGRGLTTRYSFWQDPEKMIRSTKPEALHGIHGMLTRKKQLAPIAVVHLDPPKGYHYIHDGPVQIYLSYYPLATGYSITKPNFSGRDCYGCDLCQGWEFENEQWKRYRYKIKNWRLVNREGFYELHELKKAF